MEPFKLSLDEIAEMTRESRPVIYDAINAGHLATFLVGRRRFARPEKVRAWVDFLESESNAGRPVVYRARAA
jgi:predicted DNA-binding transcriptional regulator AlpA